MRLEDKYSMRRESNFVRRESNFVRRESNFVRRESNRESRGSIYGDGRPATLINNFTSEDFTGRQRSKSVLFTGNKRVSENRDAKVEPRTDDNSNSVSRSTARGSISNGYRSSSRHGSECEIKDYFRSSTPRMSLSRASMVSTRLSSVKSDDIKAFRGSGDGKGSGSMSSESEDGGCSVMQSQSCLSPWDAFDEHVKGVTVSSDLVCRKSRMSFASSNTFQQTMTDLYGNPEYGIEPEVPKKKKGHFSNAACRLMATNRRWRGTLHDAALKEANERPKPSRVVLENARRGWRLLRRHVQEMIAEKKGSNAAFMWSSLTQTVRQLSDMEKTRMDLYKRYGIIPTVQPDGTMGHVNTMLSEKARAASATSTSTTVSMVTGHGSRSRVMSSRQSTYSRKSDSLWSRTS